MMHSVHAPITTPVPLGLDGHGASPACDVPGESSGTVWYTLVDFIRTVVEARANSRLSGSLGAAGERGPTRTAERGASFH
jgi:hypothetical protein